MTAIFAYVKDDNAFVAADTRRAILSLSTVATKVHHRWSEHILLAQTGAGQPMTELLCEMTVWRDRNPGLVTFQGLVDVFNKLHAEHFRKAQERTKTTVIGTLVAACAADGISPAQIVTFDFETGAQTVVGACGSVYADGTDQAGFLEIAQSQFARFGTSDRLELDGWAIACLEQAIAARPNAVGWPADLAIVRPYPAPARLTILRRIHDSTEPLNPAFAL